MTSHNVPFSYTSADVEVVSCLSLSLWEASFILLWEEVTQVGFKFRFPCDFHPQCTKPHQPHYHSAPNSPTLETLYTVRSFTTTSTQISESSKKLNWHMRLFGLNSAVKPQFGEKTPHWWNNMTWHVTEKEQVQKVMFWIVHTLF